MRGRRDLCNLQSQINSAVKTLMSSGSRCKYCTSPEASMLPNWAGLSALKDPCGGQNRQCTGLIMVENYMLPMCSNAYNVGNYIWSISLHREMDPHSLFKILLREDHHEPRHTWSICHENTMIPTKCTTQIRQAKRDGIVRKLGWSHGEDQL